MRVRAKLRNKQERNGPTKCKSACVRIDSVCVCVCGWVRVCVKKSERLMKKLHKKRNLLTKINENRVTKSLGTPWLEISGLPFGFLASFASIVRRIKPNIRKLSSGECVFMLVVETQHDDGTKVEK